MRRLYAVDEVAAGLGLHVGQKAADATALVPELDYADADPEGDLAALAALSDWCVRYSPAVAVDAPDGLLLDIAGVSHLWGGEGPMLDDLLDRLAANGIPARGAIADTAGAAWALARYTADRTIAPPGGQRALLEPLPIGALRLDEKSAAQLPRLGLTRIARLTALPRMQLARRFGLNVLRRLDQAMGEGDEALSFRRPASPWFDRLAFAEPISQLEDFVRAAGDIAALLCKRLETEGKGARRFELTFHRLDGKAFPARVGLSIPGRDPGRLVRLLAPKLETIDPGFGVEVVTLEAQGVESLSARQQRLDAATEVAAEEGLAAMVDRLTNRLGEARVWRDIPYPSHAPERAATRLGAMETPAPAAANAPPTPPWSPDTPRPLRLFAQPEPLEVMAKLPDDPPVRFTWRGRSHKVRRAEGPERVAEEWWRKAFEDASPDRVRDYYRVEDDAGARFWIFRAGLYGDPAIPPRWWLHGLFS
ncbi:MAG: protein imuB [Caulobacter sp.]|nr:protein imuB [Caulobacter sp.]